jgi:hypothetical protein
LFTYGIDIYQAGCDTIAIAEIVFGASLNKILMASNPPTGAALQKMQYPGTSIGTLGSHAHQFPW